MQLAAGVMALPAFLPPRGRRLIRRDRHHDDRTLQCRRAERPSSHVSSASTCRAHTRPADHPSKTSWVRRPTMGSARAMRGQPGWATRSRSGRSGPTPSLSPSTPILPYKPDVDFAPNRARRRSGGRDRRAEGFSPASLKEFAAYLKANGDKLNMAHSGIGSISHFSGLLVEFGAGCQAHVGPVQRRRSRRQRVDRRPGRLYVRADLGNRAACTGRNDQDLCDRNARSKRGIARGPDHEGSGIAGIPDVGLVRVVRAEGNPGGCSGCSQRRPRQGA